MSYRLHIDYANRQVMNDLPERVRDAVAFALIAASDDPYSATHPHGEDDGIMRDLVLDKVIVALYVGQSTKTMSVLQRSPTSAEPSGPPKPFRHHQSRPSPRPAPRSPPGSPWLADRIGRAESGRMSNGFSPATVRFAGGVDPDGTRLTGTMNLKAAIRDGWLDVLVEGDDGSQTVLTLPPRVVSWVKFEPGKGAASSYMDSLLKEQGRA
jgi:hypothetical protein